MKSETLDNSNIEEYAAEEMLIEPPPRPEYEAEPSKLGTTTVEIEIDFVCCPVGWDEDEEDFALMQSRKGEPSKPLEEVLAELGIA